MGWTAARVGSDPRRGGPIGKFAGFRRDFVSLRRSADVDRGHLGFEFGVLADPSAATATRACYHGPFADCGGRLPRVLCFHLFTSRRLHESPTRGPKIL